MSEAVSQGTFIRIKRRLDEEPLNEILISSKKQCLDTKRNDHRELAVFKRLDSVPVQCDFIHHAKDLLAKRKNNMVDLKLNYKKGYRDNRHENLRLEVQAKSAAKRYTLTACKRNMVDGDGSLLEFKVFQAMLEDDMNQGAIANNKMSKEVLSGSVKIPIIQDINDTDNQAITCNGELMNASLSQSWVIDIYHSDVCKDLVGAWGNVVDISEIKEALSDEKDHPSSSKNDVYDENDEAIWRNNTLEGHLYSKSENISGNRKFLTYRKKGSIYSTIDDDDDDNADDSDENAEDNIRNEYPDEDHFTSDSEEDCEFSSRLRKMGINDSCSDSSDDDNLNGSYGENFSFYNNTLHNPYNDFSH